MKLFDWIEKAAKKMKWYDFSLLKLTMFLFTLFLVTVWPDFRTLALSIAWYWYLIAALICAIPLWKKLFFD